MQQYEKHDGTESSAFIDDILNDKELLSWSSDTGDISAWSAEYSTRRARSASVPYRKSQLARAIAISMLFVMLVLFTIYFTTQTSYAIYMNGESLGSAKDITVVEEALENAETQVSEILGYDYPIRDSIELGAGKAGLTIAKSGDKLETAILENIDEISKLYALKIDGRIVAACEKSNELEKLLSRILDRYTNSNTTSVAFSQTVTIAREYIKSDVLQDIGEIERMLDPENLSSPSHLIVKSDERCVRNVDIDFDYEYKYDDTEYDDVRRVISPGVLGTEALTEQIQLLNGVEIGRITLNSTVVVAPVNEVILVGTLERPYYASYGEYHWPTNGVLTSYFGYRNVSVGSTNHQGIDIAGSYGQAIRAADGGEVIFADTCGGYGNLVKILHDNGQVTYYGHCSSLNVSVGELVGRDQVIAFMGSTGVSTGDHLHFEVHTSDGSAVNPLDYLS